MVSDVYRSLCKFVKLISVAILILSNSDSWFFTEVNAAVPVIWLVGQQ